jgi:acyl dehydratase
VTAADPILGTARGPLDACIDGEVLRLFAAATRDRSPEVLSGTAVPPVAVVTQIWGALEASRTAPLLAELERTCRTGLHGEHDIVLRRPLVPGEPLRVLVTSHGARPVGDKVLVTLRYTALDRHDAVVVEQLWTTVYVGTGCEPVGEPPPEHAFPDAARAQPLGTWTVDVDADMPRRYAEVSGDWSAHHFDVEVARRSGFDRPFLHGLCTMALCGRAVTELVAGGDPNRVRRIAVRFASPTFVGEDLQVDLYDAGALGCAFEATSAGATVISHGRAELF